MSEFKEIIEAVQGMRNSIVQNYVIAGLTSSLVGGGNYGCVRLFEGSRYQQDAISPHSHRFDFACLVLQGRVTNRIWTESNDVMGDFFQESRLVYQGSIGSHEKVIEGRNFYIPHDEKYSQGECYSMKHDEIHSIVFSRDSIVLFFEGPNISDQSIILEPIVDGSVIPTYEKRDYMFRKVKQEAESQ